MDDKHQKTARDLIQAALEKTEDPGDLIPMEMDPLVRSFMTGGTTVYTREETRYYDGSGNLLGKGPVSKKTRREDDA